MPQPFTPAVKRRPLAPVTSRTQNVASTPLTPTRVGHKNCQATPLPPISRSSGSAPKSHSKVPSGSVQKTLSTVSLPVRRPTSDENDMALRLRKETMRRQLAEASLEEEKRDHAETRRKADAEMAKHAPELDELNKETKAHSATLDKLAAAMRKANETDALVKDLLQQVLELKEQQRRDQELISYAETKADKTEAARAALAVKCAEMEAERGHKAYGRKAMDEVLEHNAIKLARVSMAPVMNQSKADEEKAKAGKKILLLEKSVADYESGVESLTRQMGAMSISGGRVEA